MIDHIDAAEVGSVYDQLVLGEDDVVVAVESVYNGTVLTKPRLIYDKIDTVIGWLRLLRDDFSENVGHGWKMSDAAVDRYDDEWGGIEDVDKLVVIGRSLGLITYMFPKESWPTLPAGLPYITISRSVYEHHALAR